MNLPQQVLKNTHDTYILTNKFNISCWSVFNEVYFHCADTDRKQRTK